MEPLDRIRLALREQRLDLLTLDERRAFLCYLTKADPFALEREDEQKAYGLLQEAISKATPWGDHLFPVFRVVTTPRAVRLAARATGGQGAGATRELFCQLLERHQRGDWGDVDAADRQVNDGAVHYGERLLSAYKVADGTLWCITEWDRSKTTFLTPEEY